MSPRPARERPALPAPSSCAQHRSPTRGQPGTAAGPGGCHAPGEGLGSGTSAGAGLGLHLAELGRSQRKLRQLPAVLGAETRTAPAPRSFLPLGMCCLSRKRLGLSSLSWGLLLPRTAASGSAALGRGSEQPGARASSAGLWRAGLALCHSHTATRRIPHVGREKGPGVSPGAGQPTLLRLLSQRTAGVSALRVSFSLFKVVNKLPGKLGQRMGKADIES